MTRYSSRRFIIDNGPTWTDLLRQEELQKQIADLERDLEKCDDPAEAQQIQTRIDLLKRDLGEVAII
jgi:hypothetical protein